jgi:hypothetical protein
MFEDSHWNDFVTVVGVKLEQGKEPDAKTPVLPARVECFKTLGECIVATLGSEGSKNIFLSYYDIQKWDQYEIVASSDMPCRRDTIHIDRPGKTLLVINTGAYENVEACTQLFGPPGKTKVTRLGDGKKIRNARQEAFWAASSRIKLIRPMPRG